MSNSEWRLSYIGSALVVSSGLLYTKQTKPKGLTLDNILEMIKEHPHMSYYEKKLRRRVTLGDALSQDKFNGLGKETNMVSSIDLIRLGHDRMFAKTPQTGQQLLSKHYNSKPVRIGE